MAGFQDDTSIDIFWLGPGPLRICNALGLKTLGDIKRTSIAEMRKVSAAGVSSILKLKMIAESPMEFAGPERIREIHTPRAPTSDELRRMVYARLMPTEKNVSVVLARLRGGTFAKSAATAGVTTERGRQVCAVFARRLEEFLNGEE